MARKPAKILYGADEPLPWPLAFGLGAQHCLTMATILVLAAQVVEEVGATGERASEFVRLTMVAAGLGTILQALRRGPVGSGYLCPMGPAPTIFPATVLAAKTGGLSLVFGMTIVAGLFQGLLSLVVHRLRPFLPPEVTGVIVTMIGFTLVPVGVSGLTGLGAGDSVSEPRELALGLATLAALFGLSIWGGRALRLFATFVSLVAGYGLAEALGVLSVGDWESLSPEHLSSRFRGHTGREIWRSTPRS